MAQQSASAIKSKSGTNAQNLFIGYCKVMGWALHNNNGSNVVGLLIYDLARTPIVGTDIPLVKIVVPNATVNNSFNFSQATLEAGLALYNGLSIAIVLGSGGKVADTSTSAVGVDDLDGILDWTVRTD